jgi:hypothetical protein
MYNYAPSVIIQFTVVITDKKKPLTVLGSAADPGCFSRIRNNNRRGEKICRSTFIVAKNMTKLTIILFLYRYRKEFEPIHKKLLYFLPKILSRSSQIYRSGIRDPEKNIFLSPGSKRLRRSPLKKTADALRYKQWARPKRPKPSREIDT